MKITAHTAVYGIVGFPLGHTLSPVMHNTAFRETGLDGVYIPFETRDIAGAVRGMKALGIRGLSVTLPHKTDVMPLLDHIDPRARAIGAVNTIVNRRGVLTGHNTDATGALRALEAVIRIPGKQCLIVGAGGAARTIGVVLREKGAHVTITNRSPGRGRDLARAVGCAFVPMTGAGDVPADLLIQATSVGMFPHVEDIPLSPEFLKPGMVVMDIIYNPVETRFLSLAREKGCTVIRGLGMFVHQGAEQFRLWTGMEPPVAEMARAAEAVLEKGG